MAVTIYAVNMTVTICSEEDPTNIPLTTGRVIIVVLHYPNAPS
jgi:hypothetical protein